MRYGSVCSGIEAASHAWEPLGFVPAWFSEIAPFPSKFLAARFPKVPNHGSLVGLANRLAGSDRFIDLLVGGTPCQSFSIAGLRGGLADERGNLTLEFARLAQALRPRWLLWENVPGVLSADGGRAFGSLVGALVELGYGLAWRVLDAQFFGLAQRRERVFVVGHLGAAAAAGAVLFEPEGVRRNPPARRATGEEVAGALGSGSGGFGGDLDRCGAFIPEWPKEIAPTLNASFGSKLGLENQHIDGGAGLFVEATCVNARQDPLTYGDLCGLLDTDGQTYGVCATGDVTHALRSVGCDASEDGTGRGTPITTAATRVRRLTPRECERLQGFPDDATAIDGAKDTPRYAALGNSMAVPVMRWIGERIAKVDALLREVA